MQGLFTSKLALRRHLRDVAHFEADGACVRVFPDLTLKAMQEAHEAMHMANPRQSHRHLDYGDPQGPCQTHMFNPGECPSAHVCKHCGGTLACHYGTGAMCERYGRGFYPNDETLAKFPEFYPPLVTVAD